MKYFEFVPYGLRSAAGEECRSCMWWLCPPLANISVQENIYENKIRCSSIILDIYMQKFPLPNS